MRIPPRLNPYLEGTKYSNGIKLPFKAKGRDLRYRSRVDILSGAVRGKNVIHIGFADHDVESIEAKLKSRTWLHALLTSSAERCFGVDIDEVAVNYVRDLLGYKDVAALDIINDSNDTIDDNSWDLLVLPEVLEHVDNPAEFLGGIRKRFLGSVDQMIITVPNAFRQQNFNAAKEGYEGINSDHRYWFTPYTLAKVATVAGYEVQQVRMCAHGGVRRDPKSYAYLAKYPLLREDIVMTLSLAGAKLDEGHPKT